MKDKVKIEDGVYEIAIDESDLVLDVEHGDTDDGTQIIAYNRTDNLNQRFRITAIEDDIYTIVDLNSYKALEVDQHNQKVQIAAYNPNKDTMKWRIEKYENEDGLYLIRNVQFWLVLDSGDNRKQAETPIYAYPYHVGSTQRFRLNKKEIGDVNMPQNNPYNQGKGDFDNIMDLLKPTSLDKLLTSTFSSSLVPPAPPTPAAPPVPPVPPIPAVPPVPPIPPVFPPMPQPFPEPAVLKADILGQMQTALDDMKKQLDEMRKKQESAKPKTASEEETAGLVAEIDAQIKESQDKLGSSLKQFISNSPEIKAISAATNVCKFGDRKDVRGTHSSSFMTTMDSMDEDGLAAALEPFTNPRRIKLLKVLLERELPANEISQVTGLVGGQLYHHLQNLESAGLIEKTHDKYKATTSAESTLCLLYTAIGGTKIART